MFVHRKTSQDVLEITESALDFNITNGRVRFRFSNEIILGDIGVFESEGQVKLLVCTQSAVHMIVLPHPSRLQQYVSHSICLMVYLCVLHDEILNLRLFLP